MNDYQRACELKEETIANRRYIHEHAEVGLELPQTRAYVMEKLKEYGQTHDIEILLAGENVREKAKEVKAGLKMILCDGEFVSKGEAKEEASVYKYQSGDCILQEVMACYCIAPPQPGLALMGKSGLVMGVYSPVGRCGKTSFALALAHMLGKSQAVLFISLEEYSGFSKLRGI